MQMMQFPHQNGDTWSLDVSVHTTYIFTYVVYTQQRWGPRGEVTQVGPVGPAEGKVWDDSPPPRFCLRLTARHSSPPQDIWCYIHVHMHVHDTPAHMDASWNGSHSIMHSLTHRTVPVHSLPTGSGTLVGSSDMALIRSACPDYPNDGDFRRCCSEGSPSCSPGERWRTTFLLTMRLGHWA